MLGAQGVSKASGSRAAVAWFPVLVLSAALGAFPGRVQAAPRPTQASSPKRDVSELLKAELQTKLPQIGTLADWQDRVFKEEVLPQYTRFVRDYRPGGSGVVADIDVPGMKAYLTWGRETDPKSEVLRFGVVVRAGSDCMKCQEASLPLRKEIKARLDRRGISALFLDEDPVAASDKWVGATLNEKLSELARKRGLVGLVRMDLRLAPVDPDSAHADERTYLAKIFQLDRLRGSELRHEGQLEVLENDSLFTAAERLLGDAVANFGSKFLESSATRAQEASGRELRLSLTGWKGWQQYRDLRARLIQALKPLGSVDEQLYMRGRVDFRVRTLKSLADVESLAVATIGKEAAVKVEDMAIQEALPVSSELPEEKR